MTTVTAENGKLAASASRVWTMSGRPAQLRYCFGRSPPSLTPRPPATIRSPTLFDDNSGPRRSLETPFRALKRRREFGRSECRLDLGLGPPEQSLRIPCE